MNQQGDCSFQEKSTMILCILFTNHARSYRELVLSNIVNARVVFKQRFHQSIQQTDTPTKFGQKRHFQERKNADFSKSEFSLPILYNSRRLEEWEIKFK